MVWYRAPTGAKFFTERHRYASLNNRRGVFTDDGGIGEVPGAARVWSNGSLPASYDGLRVAGATADFVSGCTGEPDLVWFADGSMPYLCSTDPCLPCFTVDNPGYSTVEFRSGPSGSWLPMAHVSGDHWTASYSVSGNTLLLDTDCGALRAGCQGLRVRFGSLPSPTTFGAARSLTLSSHQYDYYVPPIGAFPGLQHSIRTSIPSTPTFPRQHASIGTNNSTSTPLTLSEATLAGSTLLAVVTQMGTAGVGGSLATPTIPGWTLLGEASAHQMSILYRHAAPSVTGVTLTTNGVADNLIFTVVEFAGTSPGVPELGTTMWPGGNSASFNITQGGTVDACAVVAAMRIRNAVGPVPSDSWAFSPTGGGTGSPTDSSGIMPYVLNSPGAASKIETTWHTNWIAFSRPSSTVWTVTGFNTLVTWLAALVRVP